MYTLLVTGDVPGASSYFNPLLQQTIVPCTSGTRPTPSHDGMTVYETDTDLHATWNGSAWVYPYTPAYTSITPTFYSNVASGTVIAGGNVSVSYAKYQAVGKRVHYYGHAQINTTTAGGFGLSLPVAVGFRSFSLSTIHLTGASGDSNYGNAVGIGFVPSISAPYNRFGPVNRANVQINIVTSGDACMWNVTYESV